MYRRPIYELEEVIIIPLEGEIFPSDKEKEERWFKINKAYYNTHRVKKIKIQPPPWYARYGELITELFRNYLKN